MAERRMFAKSIVLSDAFLDMPMSARCLYFTLGMLADDDGFVGSPKSIMRQCGASDDDMNILLVKRYILGFESGVLVIKHWRMNNYLRNDRYNQTTYLEEKNTLTIDEKGAYTERKKSVGIPSGRQVVYTGKDSIGKDSIGKSIEKRTRHKYGEYNNVVLSDEDIEKLKAEIPNYEQYIEKVSEYVASTGKSYKNYLATIRNWYRRDNEKHQDVAIPNYQKEAINNQQVDISTENEILKELGKL